NTARLAADVLPLLRPFFVKLGRDGIEIGSRLLNLDAVFQAPHHQKPAVPALGQVTTARDCLPDHHRRYPPIRREAAQQSRVFFRRDADNGEWMAVDSDAAAHGRRIAAEARLPELVTDDGDRALAWRPTLFRQKAAPERRFETERGNIVTAY